MNNKAIVLARKVFQPQFLLLWVLLVIVLLFSAASSAFRTPDNLLEILRSSSIIAILVLGLTWIVASGEIDVSFPDIAAFASMVTAYFVQIGWSWAAAILLALFLGALFGFVSGFLITRFRIPPLIATIGISTIAKATANFIGGGGPIYLMIVNPSVEFVVYGKVLGIPVLFLVVLAIYLVARYLQDETTTGQYLYALGENRQAALEAGIPERRIIWSFYVLSALLAACGGILLTATFTSGQPNFPGLIFVDGLTAVFLGALIIRAGKPNVIGTLIGAILLSVLVSGLTMLSVPFYVGLIIKGGLMVLGVAVITFSKYRLTKQARPAELKTPAVAN